MDILASFNRKRICMAKKGARENSPFEKFRVSRLLLDGQKQTKHNGKNGTQEI